MNKAKLKWYNPQNFEEAYKIHLNNPLIIPCAGSTGILRTKRFKNEGFINLKYCNLSYIKEDKINNIIRIGATTTFNEIIEYLKSQNYSEDSFFGILLNSLSSAASYPLRNRITIGGSLFDLPIWSDIISPLLLTETNIIYNDDKNILLPEYIEKRKKIPHIIKEIVIKYNTNIQYFTQRFSLTNFDYAVFRFSFSYSISQDFRFNYFNCAISGTKNLIFIDKSFNEQFINICLDDEESLKKVIEKQLFGFSSDFRFDEEYKEKTCKNLLIESIKRIKN